MLLNILQEPACRVLFIDNNWNNVKAAKNLGIDAIQFINLRKLKKELKKRGFNLDEAENQSLGMKN